MQQTAVSRSAAAFEPDVTLTVVVELSRAAWLVAALIPGIERRPLKKLLPNEEDLLLLLERWCEEAEAAGRGIRRIVLAYEAGRDGFWLARWLRGRGIEAHVIHASSVAVPRERRRAKTDRLDTALLLRVLLGWLRGELGHCSMAIVPDLDQEDAKRPNRERENLIGERTRVINRMKATFARLGVRGFNPARRNATEQLSGLATPEAGSLPANALAEMRRDMARLRLMTIRSRRSSGSGFVGLRKLDGNELGPMPWCTRWPASSVSGLRPPTCLRTKFSSVTCAIVVPSLAMPG